MSMILIMQILSFLSLKKVIIDWTEKNICINAFCYENDLIYLVNISNEKFEDCLDWF